MTNHKPDPNRAVFGSPAFVGLMLMSDDDHERQQLGYSLLAASLLIAVAEDLQQHDEQPWATAAKAQARRATEQHQRAH